MRDIVYQELSREILDLEAEGRDIPPWKLESLSLSQRFYEVRVLEGELLGQDDRLRGYSLKIQHHQIGASVRDKKSIASDRCWGASVLIGGGERLRDAYINPENPLFKNAALSDIDTAWISVAEPEYSGSCGDLRLDEYLKGRGVGSFLLNKSVEWLSGKHSAAIVRPIHLSHVDGECKKNKQRRNKLYLQFGIAIDFSEEVSAEYGQCVSGRSGYMLASSLQPLDDPVKGKFDVLTYAEYEQRLAELTAPVKRAEPKKSMWEKLLGG